MIVILIRHGQPDTSGHLSNEGILQIEEKLPRIFAIISAESTIDKTKDIVLVSSSAPRAVESMEIIAKGLKLQFTVEGKLWADNKHPTDYPWLFETIQTEKEKGTKIVLYSTHLDYVNDFPLLYHAKLEITGIYENCKYAEGVVLDFNQKRMRNL